MLRSIALIGGALNSQGGDEWRHLVDRSTASDVFVISTDGDGKYKDVSVEHNEGGERYLYRRDYSGKPGIFITGKISSQDMKFIKSRVAGTTDFDKLLDEDRVRAFVRNKIGWYFLRKAILDDEDATANVPESSKRVLATVINEVTSNKDEIAKRLFRLISQGDYNSDVLITVKVGARYPSEVPGFPSIFKHVSQAGRPSKAVSSNEVTSAHCIVCGSSAPNKLRKKPLQFVTFDKPNFIPGGNKQSAAIALPLCDECYENLQIGERYIRDNLNFNIPYTKGAKNLSFWLIPVLNNSELVKRFMRKPEKGLSSFKSMNAIAKDFESVRSMDSVSEELWSGEEQFLTYSALFYYSDPKGHMTPVEVVDGILPSRLGELAEKKFEVDELSGHRVLFHFGLVREFLFSESKNDTEKMDDFRMLSHIMASIFTARKLNQHTVTSMVMRKIRQKARKQDSDGFEEVTLKSVSLLEYLYRVGCL